jgi:PAS domain S-box-containing protein
MTGLQEEKGRSIQSRLFLLLLCIVIPVMALQAYLYYESYQSRRSSELQTNLEIARAVAKSFESFIKDVLHQELVLGLAITSATMTPKDIARLFEASQNYLSVRDFTWMSPRGDAVYSGNPSVIGNNYRDRTYFSEIANGREWTVSELLISRATGKPVFGISRGIRDSKGVLLGVVVAIIIPEKLDARLAVERGKGGGHALVDNKGMLVYRYPAITTTWEERNWLKPYPEFGEALRGKEIAKTVYAPFEGKNRMVGFTPVSFIGWAASAGKREEDITGPILSSIGKSALLFASVLLAAFLGALAVSRKITSPVAGLHAHALALGNGKVTEQVKIKHVSEFQDLAEAFNTMAEKVQARETDLRESEQRWATTLASIGDGVIATDVDGRITFMNDVAEKLTGWTLGEAAMKPATAAFTIVNEHTRKEVESPITKVLREGMIVGLANHTILIKKDGTEVPIDDSGAPIRDKEGKSIGVVLVFRDITERKKNETALADQAALLQERASQLEAVNNELESFSYSISHDLRAPLRAIDGYSRMILRKHTDKFDTDALDKFNVIRDNIRMMGQLIDGLLDFSRLGRAKLSTAALDMAGLIGEGWEELKIANPDRCLTLNIGEIPPCRGDRTLIKQALVNILGNAVKFTRRREQALIEVCGAKKDGEIVYSVRDNGVGFDMKFHDKMFGVFQRLHTDSEFEGTGVGLAIVQRIIVQHGGRIWAEGEEGKGAAFYFTLESLT